MPHHNMKNYWLFGFVLLTVSACNADQPDNRAAFEAGLHRAVEAEIIGEGIISTTLPEFATTVSPDGNTMYFNRTSADRSTLQIFASEKVAGVWQSPKALPFSDGTFSDVDPFVTPDGARVYFSSNRPVSGDAAKDYDTWYIQKENAGWSTPINAGVPLNGEEGEIFVSVTRDNTVYFSISRNGVRRIYRSVFLDDQHTTPQEVSLPVADSVGVGNPLIDPDEAHLFFTSRQLDGFGNADIFIADHIGNGVFENVRNAGPLVNSAYSDFAPGLSGDGSELYFTSERPGIVGPLNEGRPPGDLYKVSLKAVLDGLANE